MVSREHLVEAANIYRYAVEFRAQYLDPLDPDVDCHNYVADHQYNECFESKVEKDLMEEIGCNYPWFTDSQDVCNDSLKLPVEILLEGQDKKHLMPNFCFIFTVKENIIGKYLGDRFYAPCSKPCRTVQIEAVFKKAFQLKRIKNRTVLYFEINPRVIVTQVITTAEERELLIVILFQSIMKTGVIDVINNIGSSLGLWIGMSMLSAVKSMQNISGICIKNSKKMRILAGSAGMVLIFLVPSTYFVYHSYQNSLKK